MTVIAHCREIAVLHRNGSPVLIEHDSVSDSHQFVLAGLDGRIQLADDYRDDLERAFAWTSRKFVSALGEDIVDRTWAHDEIATFLLRAAQHYRRHPDYSTEWH